MPFCALFSLVSLCIFPVCFLFPFTCVIQMFPIRMVSGALETLKIHRVKGRKWFWKISHFSSSFGWRTVRTFDETYTMKYLHNANFRQIRKLVHRRTCQCKLKLAYARRYVGITTNVKIDRSRYKVSPNEISVVRKMRACDGRPWFLDTTIYSILFFSLHYSVFFTVAFRSHHFLSICHLSLHFLRSSFLFPHINRLRSAQYSPLRATVLRALILFLPVCLKKSK